MFKRILVLTAGVCFLVPASASAQVAWDSPFLMGPSAAGGLGFHLVDPHPGGGIGAMVTWRRAPVPGGIGMRAGLAEGFQDETAGFGGIDFSGRLLAPSQDFPLDLTWAGGAGLGVGEYALVSFPLGLYVGRSLVGDGIRFSPYGGFRVNLDGHLGRETPAGADDDELELAFSVDFGGDIVFSNDLAVRFGATLVDHEALSIGIVLPAVR